MLRVDMLSGHVPAIGADGYYLAARGVQPGIGCLHLPGK